MERNSLKKVTAAAQSRDENDPQRVKAVRIACWGERYFGVQEMNELDIPIDHDVFDIGEECPISKIVGIPILVSKTRPSLDVAAMRDSCGSYLDHLYYRNTTVEELMVCCDTKLAEESGERLGLFQTPKRWTWNVGNVILARADRKPLYTHHAKVLYDFMYPVLASNWPDRTFEAFKIVRIGRLASLPIARPASDKDRLLQLAPGDFKDYYFERRCAWKIETEDSARLAELPTPWSWKERPAISLKRKLIRRDYKEMSDREKFRKTDNWKERALLEQIRGLKRRLEEVEGEVEKGPKEKRARMVDDEERAAG